MKLYKKSEQRNYNSIADQLKKCGGICDNRLPQGFCAIAMFDYGNRFFSFFYPQGRYLIKYIHPTWNKQLVSDFVFGYIFVS